MIIINGEKKPEAAGIRLSQYLADTGYNRADIAVECDGGIIPRQEYDRKVISDGEIIEIVSFAGGA